MCTNSTQERNRAKKGIVPETTVQMLLFTLLFRALKSKQLPAVGFRVIACEACMHIRSSLGGPEAGVFSEGRAEADIITFQTGKLPGRRRLCRQLQVLNCHISYTYLSWSKGEEVRGQLYSGWCTRHSFPCEATFIADDNATIASSCS